jgi:2-polyprenyl-3-methyl-5-hydroxy-6-metoxy-1,4-benzoquinol methylase
MIQNNSLNALYCKNCDLYKTNTSNSAEIYQKEFWEGSDHHEFTGTDFTAEGVRDLRLTFESWYSYFRNYFGQRKKILDIGSGTGISCVLLDELGYFVTGVEPDKKNAQLINAKLENGVCINSFFEDLELSEQFDIIWITHVLEHLEDPVDLLMRCRKWLNPDGIICIAVPDCENSYMLKSSINNPYHKYHFSKKSLGWIVKKAGYAMINCDSLTIMNGTKRRMHKVLRNAKLENFSKKFEPFYPFTLTTKNNGYEIRCVMS